MMQVDVSEEESVKSAFSQALEQMHTVDILINCAGYGRSSRIQDLTLEQWRRLLDVNMTGTFLCCREIIPHMVERQCGKIVLSTIPFKRKGTPTDIANLLLFLSSDESGWITGEVIAINGGAFIG